MGYGLAALSADSVDEVLGLREVVTSDCEDVENSMDLWFPEDLIKRLLGESRQNSIDRLWGLLVACYNGLEQGCWESWSRR